MFDLELHGRKFRYESLDQLAGFCYEMARVNRDNAANTDSSRKYHEGAASAFGTLAVTIESLRVRSVHVHQYITQLEQRLIEQRTTIDQHAAELKASADRIAELERLLEKVDHIGDPHAGV